MSRPIALCAVFLILGAPQGRAREHADYRNPPREYRRVREGDLVVFVEKQLLDEAPDTARAAIERLGIKRKAAIKAFPSWSREELLEIPIYVMYGPKARGGGMSNGLQYIPEAAPDHHADVDPDWRNVIVVHCADNYARITDFWALKALAHEYAHAHHLLHWKPKQPEILGAWRNAMDRGLYRGVYASVNQLEYFAELSAMYFVGCNYAPHSRAELERYDPDGAKMVKTMWGLGETESPPDTR